MKKRVESLHLMFRPDCYDELSTLRTDFDCDLCFYNHSLFCEDVDNFNWQKL